MKKKKINIQFQRSDSALEKLFSSIDNDSLELFREMMSTRFNKNMEEIDKGSLGLIHKREEYPNTTILRERLNMLKLSLKCHDKDDKPISSEDLFQFLDDWIQIFP